MYKIRQADKRGSTNLNWLDSKHSFSFNQYFDTDNMGFHTLRVINDDLVSPGRGFGMHSHRDMEIVSYVVHGSLEHKDNMGNGSIIKAGEIQTMTAGTGIMHSEFNPDPDSEVRFLQIWITPDKKNLKPAYQQIQIPEEKNKLRLIASGQDDGGVHINQDVKIFSAKIKAGNEITYSLESGRAGWIQMITGSLKVENYVLDQGDGLAIENEEEIKLTAQVESELLFFDLNMNTQ